MTKLLVYTDIDVHFKSDERLSSDIRIRLLFPTDMERQQIEVQQ